MRIARSVVGLAGAVAVGVAAVTINLPTHIGPDRTIGPSAVPSSAANPERSSGPEGPTLRPDALPGAAGDFAKPFEYLLPPGRDLIVTTSTATMFALTEGAIETYPGLGLRPVRDVRGITLAVASSPSTHGAGFPTIPLRPGPFFTDLDRNSQLQVGVVAPATLAGLPARQADVRYVERRTSAYPDLHMSGEEVLALAFPSRLIVAQMDRDTLVVHIWAADEEGLAAWLPEATGIVASIRFLPPR